MNAYTKPSFWVYTLLGWNLQSFRNETPGGAGWCGGWANLHIAYSKWGKGVALQSSCFKAWEFFTRKNLNVILIIKGEF